MTIIVSGSIAYIRARVQCGGCGSFFTVDLDPADKTEGSESLQDLVIEGIKAGDVRESPYSVTVQHGYILCADCTQKVDRYVDEDRDATEREIRDALDENDVEALEDNSIKSEDGEYLYDCYTIERLTSSSSAFPTWPELSESEREKWRDKAKREGFPDDSR